MKIIFNILFFIGLNLLTFFDIQAQKQFAEIWLTSSDESILFKKQAKTFNFEYTNNTLPNIIIDESKVFQKMDGFGFTLTGGSAMLINQMNTKERAALLQELFSTNDANIGISYLRISVGASDLDNHVFSYDDLPEGETDPELKKFNLAGDQQYLIPVLKQI